MAAAPLLASPHELAQLVGGSASDPQLLSQLRTASNRFRNAVGHDVTRTTVAQDLAGSGSSVLILPVAPVISVEAVAVDGQPVAPARYRLARSSGILTLRSGIWPRGAGMVELEYTYGFEPGQPLEPDDGKPAEPLAGIPEGIQSVVLQLAEVLLNVEAGVSSTTVLGDTTQFGAAATVGATQDWVDAVARYAIREQGV